MCMGIVYDFPENDIEVLLEDLKKEPPTEEIEIVVVNHDVGLVYAGVY